MNYVCSLKTGLTKWNADFDQAASCYGKAGTKLDLASVVNRFGTIKKSQVA